MKRFVAISAALALALATSLSAQAAKPQAAKPGALLASIQGTWQMTASNGQDLAGSGQDITVTIKDNTYVQAVNGTVAERGTFKIDESKKPYTLDISITEGDDAGKSQVGIFELNGKTMTGALGAPGEKTRPTSFAASDMVFTFVMVKK